VEPDYGDPEDPNAPAFQYGRYRTNGPEVAARGIIVMGNGANSAAPEGGFNTDGMIYLSLPLANAEALPVTVVDNSNILEDLNLYYSNGYFAHVALNGSANWNGYDVSHESNGLLLNAAPSQSVVGTSFPNGTAPSDLSSWVNVVTRDATLSTSLWTWQSGYFSAANRTPYNYHAFGGLGDGMVISWNVRYFRV
jgi:hypothetical protein